MPVEHYWTRVPSAKSEPRVVPARLRGREWTFWTDRGVFSYERVDPGTELLVETMKVLPEDIVLDWGCGYGVIGIVAGWLAREGRVYMVEPNLRAAALAMKNSIVNGVFNVKVWAGYGLEAMKPEVKFTLVLSNPPFRAGLKVIRAMLEECSRHAAPEARIYLVGRTRLGIERISKYVEELFGEAKTVAKRAGYRVVAGRKTFSIPPSWGDCDHQEGAPSPPTQVRTLECI